MLSFTAEARFGYKGVSELGRVTCYAKNSDSSLFIGTATGGVFQALNTDLDSWIARPVGLTSGKIIDLNYTGQCLVAATEDQGVFRYTGRDGTDRYWEKINTGIFDFSISSLISTDTSTLYVSTYNGKVFKSIDKGDSWQALMNLPFDGMKIIKLVKAGKRIYLFTEKNGIFKTDDAGVNWVAFNSVTTQNTFFDGIVSYNSTTSELLVSNSEGFFLLKNASLNPNPSFNALVNRVNAKINRISNLGNSWYAATDKGVYSVMNLQSQWGIVGLEGGEEPSNLAFAYYTKVVSATVSKGIFVLKQLDSDWEPSNIGLNNIKTISFANRGENTIAVATNKGVYISLDQGTSYRLQNTGLFDSLSLTDIVFKNSKLFVSCKNEGVYISLDTGNTWTPFVKGLNNLNVVKLFPSKKYIYLVNNSGELLKSDGIYSWKITQDGLTNLSNRVSFTQMNSSVVLTSFGQGIYKRNESSDTWQNITKNLPTKNVTSITYTGAKLYVGTVNQGVYVTDTLLIKWVKTSFSLSEKAKLVNVDSNEIFAMNSYKGYVFASVKGAVFATNDEGKNWMDAGTPFNLPSYTAIGKIGFTSARVFVSTNSNFIYSNQLAELPAIINITKIIFPSCGDSINELGKISVQYTGGYEPYTFQWNTTDSTSVITGLKPGKYMVTITDKNGATATDSVELFFKPCNSDTTSVIPTDTTQNNNSDTTKYHIELEEMKVYPNPTFSNIKLSFKFDKAIYLVRILDKRGSEVFRNEEYKISKLLEVGVTLDSGVYSIEVETDLGVYRQKIVFL